MYILSFIWAVKQLWFHLPVLSTTLRLSADVTEVSTMTRPLMKARQSPSQHTFLVKSFTVNLKTVLLGRGCSIVLRSYWPLWLSQTWVTRMHKFCQWGTAFTLSPDMWCWMINFKGAGCGKGWKCGKWPGPGPPPYLVWNFPNFFWRVPSVVNCFQLENFYSKHYAL